MRVFLAGASGAIGRPLVPKLIAAGHEVTGMTRSEARAEGIRTTGAEAAVVDVFDADPLLAAMTEAAPDVVVHELTALPERMNLRRNDLYEGTNRLRTEGTRNLIRGALAAGARRFVSQSIAFAYRPDGGPVKSEDDPLLDDAPAPFSSGVEALQEMEELVLGTEGLDGLVLRYGFFYGPGTHYAADGTVTQDVRRRRMPVVGDGTGVFSFIHVDDAADATVAAVERGAPGVYNIADDEPAKLSEWVPAMAQAAGAKPPRRVPVWLARLVAGRQAADFALELRGASNEKAKRELGWRPAHPSWRSGFAESMGGGEGPQH
ncbi:MAG TPA: NAD(P)-dependent oxidoreductase [Thermoleophilaceae bacterium]|nr:NAD(P)-dependent oxidoreductase [Thermoleophilaceae bacterium]